MTTREPFWWEANTWWKRLAQRLTIEPATDYEWEEARRRLWDLSHRVPESDRLNVESRRDLVQGMLLRLLQGPQLVQRLAQVDTPAHYLKRVLQNELRAQRKQQRVDRVAAKRHAELIQAERIHAFATDQRPDRLLLQKEFAAEIRFVVNHLVSARDRKLLGWYYWDGLSALEIAQRLRISEGAVCQRLVRARAKAKRALTS